MNTASSSNLTGLKCRGAVHPGKSGRNSSDVICHDAAESEPVILVEIFTR
jgi:hypothetical protein